MGRLMPGPKLNDRYRRTILDRDGWTCQLQRPFVCIAPGPGDLWPLEQRRERLVQVDHIRPRSAGGTDRASNLRAVCKPCHESRKREPSMPSRVLV